MEDTMVGTAAKLATARENVRVASRAVTVRPGAVQTRRAEKPGSLRRWLREFVHHHPGSAIADMRRQLGPEVKSREISARLCALRAAGELIRTGNGGVHDPFRYSPATPAPSAWVSLEAAVLAFVERHPGTTTYEVVRRLAGGSEPRRTLVREAVRALETESRLVRRASRERSGSRRLYLNPAPGVLAAPVEVEVAPVPDVPAPPVEVEPWALDFDAPGSEAEPGTLDEFEVARRVYGELSGLAPVVARRVLRYLELRLDEVAA